jgi:hypothetical protein
MRPSPCGTVDRRLDLRAKGAQPQVFEFKAPFLLTRLRLWLPSLTMLYSLFQLFASVWHVS